MNKTTSLHNVRRWLKNMIIGLGICCLGLIYFNITTAKKTIFLGQNLIEAQKQLEDKEKEVVKADEELRKKKDKIEILTDMIVRQNRTLKWDTALILKMQDALFNRELAMQIVQWGVEHEPGKALYQLSVKNVYEYIVYCQKWAQLYAIKYPKHKAIYNWKTGLKIIWIESFFDKDPRPSSASAIGGVQVLEYSAYGTPQQEKSLYFLLISLGYKKDTYKETIDYYRNNISVQVDCMFKVLTFKMRDKHDDVTSAIVAYNWAYDIPTDSPYWTAYLEKESIFDDCFLNAKKKLGMK